jgi:hypothetical protein
MTCYDADNHVPWFQVVAFCKISFGTIDATIVPKVGPVNARKIPVKKMIT